MYGIGIAVYPFFCASLAVIFSAFMFITYVFDKNVLFLFQLHRWFLDDDTLIAVVLIVLAAWVYSMFPLQNKDFFEYVKNAFEYEVSRA